VSGRFFFRSFFHALLTDGPSMPSIRLMVGASDAFCERSGIFARIANMLYEPYIELHELTPAKSRPARTIAVNFCPKNFSQLWSRAQ